MPRYLNEQMAFEGWEVGEEGPGPLKGRRPLLAMVTVMVRRRGRSGWRDKGLIADGASRLLEGADALPAY